MNNQYFELSVLGSNEQSLKDLVFELGITAIEESKDGFVVRSGDDLELIKFGLENLAEKLNINIKTTLEIKNNDDWIAKYQNSVEPVLCGEFYIRPSWREKNPAKYDIIIDPALAFGSGHHESTSSCLELISKYFLKNSKDKKALDVGCGSGILSIALAKIGISVDACDTEIQAVESTISNANKNAVKLNRVFKGSIDAADANYDIICANIIADVIFILSKELKSHLNENGYLILSGILNRYKDRILDEFKELKLVENISKNEWESFIFQKIQK